MLSKNFTQYLLCFLLIFVINSFEVNSLASPDKDFGPEKISGFISFLILEREYYRASVEVERLKSYYPDYLNHNTYTATINYLMFKGAAYKSILDSDNEEAVDGTDANSIFFFFKIDSLIKLNKYEEAENLIPDSGILSDPFFNNILQKREIYLSLMNNPYSGEMRSKSVMHEYQEVLDFSAYIHNQKKNPWKGMAAGLIPGMGYIYAGETGTGITAMIVMGLGVAVAALGFSQGMEPLGIVSGTVTGLFYGGSIIGGYRETVRYNRGLMERLDLRLQKDLDFNRDIDEIFVRFGLKN